MTKEEAEDLLKVYKLQEEEFNKQGYDLAISRRRCQEQIEELNKIVEAHDQIKALGESITQRRVEAGLKDAQEGKTKEKGSFIKFITGSVLDD